MEREGEAGANESGDGEGGEEGTVQRVRKGRNNERRRE
jgi:hypothetical protein